MLGQQAQGFLLFHQASHKTLYRVNHTVVCHTTFYEIEFLPEGLSAPTSYYKMQPFGIVVFKLLIAVLDNGFVEIKEIVIDDSVRT